MNGWELSHPMTKVAEMKLEDVPEMEYSKGYPISTLIPHDLVFHCQSLSGLFTDEVLLIVPVRPADAHKFHYVVGDASAEGFFITRQYPEKVITSQVGLWETTFVWEGSNLQEFQKLAATFLLR